MIVYDDSNYTDLLGDGKAVTFGGEKFYLSANPREIAYGALPYARPFGDAYPLIPRSEWAARIEHLAAIRGTPADFNWFPAYNQSRTNYCWANGVCGAATTVLAMQGAPHKKLISSASIAGPITNYRNVGGWGEPAFEYLLKYGGCSMDLWPNAAISRSYDTELSRAERQHLRGIEGFDTDGFDQLATALLLGFPVAVAYNWWGHLVFAAELVLIEANSFGVRIRNSWHESWGEKHPRNGMGGYTVLREGKGTPSSAVTVRAMVSSAMNQSAEAHYGVSP